MNTIKLIGHIHNQFELDYTSNNETFYKNTISVKRLSDAYDNLPIIVPGNLLTADIYDNVEIIGEVRTRNVMVNNRSTLQIYVFVKELSNVICDDTNKLELTGYLCKEPNFRTTPFNREITDILLAVHRDKVRRSDYLPCIAWGRNATFAKHLSTGTKVTITGRLQSREYNKVIDGETFTKTAYEVSISSIMVINDESKTENN